MKTKISFLFLFISLFALAQKRDSLSIHLPEKYELTLKNHQENEHIIFKEWVPKKETLENYTIVFTQTISKNVSSISLDLAKKTLLNSYNKIAVGVKFTDIVKESDYIIFTKEVDYYKNAPNDNEASLFFLIKGEHDLFMISVGLKEKKLPEKFIEEWTEVFKNSKFIK